MKQKFFLENLDCANCAAKIETYLSELEFIESCELSFMNQTLTITSKQFLEPNLLEYYIAKVEEGITIKTIKEEQKENNYITLIKIIGSIFFLIMAYIFEKYEIVYLILILTSFLLSGISIIIKSFQNIIKGQIFDENFLMIIAAIGAIFIKLYDEAVLIVLLYSIGEFFQEQSIIRSRKKIADLVSMQPLVAFVYKDNELKEMKIEDIKIGDIIVVKPGSRVPLDGILQSNEALLDLKSLTGEALLINKSQNEEILSGAINLDYAIEMRVTKTKEDSTLSKILSLVEEATSKKTKSEKFLTTFARYYTPIVTFIALFYAFIVPIFSGYTNFSDCLKQAIIFLVISCPCALVISVPLAYFASIGSLAKDGILLKGSSNLDAILKCNRIFLDKTGTLTTGEFSVEDICLIEDSTYFRTLVTSLEKHSSHPIAKIITKKYKTELLECSNIVEVKGMGITGIVDGHDIKIGNRKLVPNEIEITDGSMGLFVEIDKKLGGYFILNDTLKEEAPAVISYLKKLGMEINVLSGDDKKRTLALKNELEIDNAYGELLPADKYDIAMRAKDNGHHFIYVGDGINDTPVLALSNVGISLGGASDSAIEAAGCILMNDNLRKIITLYEKAKLTRLIVIINIIFSISIKLGVMIVTMLGYSNIILALFADVGVSILAILNSIRLMRHKKNK